MASSMDDGLVSSISLGLSQKGVRDHNERLLLSLVLRHGAMPASELSRLAGLSPPTVSGIVRRLEAEGLLVRGEPTRGKVGKPSVPMTLAANGAFAIGIKIGRRSTDFLLLDLVGQVRLQRRLTYPVPEPETIFDFIEREYNHLLTTAPPDELARIRGIGVAAPFEMWSWVSGDAEQTQLAWRDIHFAERIGQFSDLPVSLMNDATAACQAEHIFGGGKHFRDYSYFFVGAFVGGGVVLNNSVFVGRQGNAGSLGALRSIGPNGESQQLIDTASIHLLEKRLREVDLDPAQLWQTPQDWTPFRRYVDPWLGQIAQELAKASLSTCAVIDFEAVVIDGAFPEDIRLALVDRVRRYVSTQDRRGLIIPRIEAGRIGANARAIGAASAPMFEQIFFNPNTIKIPA